MRCPVCHTPTPGAGVCAGCGVLLDAQGRVVVQDIQAGEPVLTRDFRRAPILGRSVRQAESIGENRIDYSDRGLVVTSRPNGQLWFTEEHVQLRDGVCRVLLQAHDPHVTVGLLFRHIYVGDADAHVGFEVWPGRQQARMFLRASVGKRAWRRDLTPWTPASTRTPWIEMELRARGAELQGFVGRQEIARVHEASLGTGHVGLRFSSTADQPAAVTLSHFWLWMVA